MALSSGSGGILVDYQPMSPEEIERTVQFLLQQQAQFVAEIAKLSTKTDRIADGLIGLTGIVGRVAVHLERLALAQEDTDRQLKATDERLSAHIGTVESHLNVVIEMFERHLRDEHGPKPS